ncbi:hypothetical protein [Methylobrevis pamukkalensis]|uniref:Uncharacterized protein n=1 Tax=Methylobrevis pamukkalensis TaxID=1439726 RepID=A0A1E3GZM5_9HYPH|nr:hypothetical protein [Methylobrevis pamukkalensis]ODN69494.1 hypothetical protein A6302_03220 [Methylobrevis pamukkalensis]
MTFKLTLAARTAALLVAGAVITATSLAIAGTGAAPTDANVRTYDAATGFDHRVGAHQAIGYFTPTANACALTVLLAPAQDGDVTVHADSARIEFAVPAGEKAAVKAADGSSLAFACADDVGSLSVSQLAPGAI